MSTIADRGADGPAIASQPARITIPLWAAVIASRLIVLTAAAAAALFTQRVPGWELGGRDPYRLSSSLGSVGNVLGASVLRWDSIHYINIAQHGYTHPANTAFYPLYPLLIRVVGWVVRSYVLAGVLISFAIALLLLHRLAKEELGARVADSTVLLLAFAPLSFFFTAIYTESLFLAFSVGVFSLARRQRFAWACVTAAAAALTHVEGVLLVAPLAYMYWRDRGRPRVLRRLWSWAATLLVLPPVAVAGFFVYLHSQGWGWLAPVRNVNFRFYGRVTLTTPVMLWKATDAGITGLLQTLQGVKPIAPSTEILFSIGFQNTVYLGVLVISLTALVATWRWLPREYAIYTTLVIVVCTWSGVVGRPLVSYDRYMLVAFPLWIAAAAWLDKRRLTPTVLLLSSLMLVFYTVEFARWAFIG
jgi:hypothetical protein